MKHEQKPSNVDLEIQFLGSVGGGVLLVLVAVLAALLWTLFP
jgi:hypothetical protein